MKDLKVFEKNVSVLRTSIIDVEIVDENGNNILFDIVESTNTDHTMPELEESTVEDNVPKYNERQIRICTSNITAGKKYFVKTSKPIEYRDSDEQLFTYGYTEGTQTFAISFPDPNDDRKCWKNEYTPDWCDFVEEGNGKMAVSFCLIDTDIKYLYITAAWIWNIHSRMLEYESTAEVFTWSVWDHRLR